MFVDKTMGDRLAVERFAFVISNKIIENKFTRVTS